MLLFGLLLGILCIYETEKIRFQMVTGCIYGTMKRLDECTSINNSQLNLGLKHEDEKADDFKWEARNDISVISLTYLNASQTPCRDKALKWMLQLRQPNAVWSRHSQSSGLLSLAILALYSRTPSGCHDLSQWPLSSCSIGKGRAACRRGKGGSMEWWSHRRKRWKMPGYPQNASMVTPCRHRHSRSLGNSTRKCCMAAFCKR